MLSFFLKIMNQKCGSYVCVQLLQTLNILFENIRNETSICKFFFFINIFLVCPIWLPLFLSFLCCTNQDWVSQESILAWLLHHFHLVLNKIRTHDLLIVSRVCYPLDRTFALTICRFLLISLPLDISSDSLRSLMWEKKYSSEDDSQIGA